MSKRWDSECICWRLCPFRSLYTQDNFPCWVTYHKPLNPYCILSHTPQYKDTNVLGKEWIPNEATIKTTHGTHCKHQTTQPQLLHSALFRSLTVGSPRASVFNLLPSSVHHYCMQVCNTSPLEPNTSLSFVCQVAYCFQSGFTKKIKWDNIEIAQYHCWKANHMLEPNIPLWVIFQITNPKSSWPHSHIFSSLLEFLHVFLLILLYKCHQPKLLAQKCYTKQC